MVNNNLSCGLLVTLNGYFFVLCLLTFLVTIIRFVYFTMIVEKYFSRNVFFYLGVEGYRICVYIVLIFFIVFFIVFFIILKFMIGIYNYVSLCQNTRDLQMWNYRWRCFAGLSKKLLNIISLMVFFFVYGVGMLWVKFGFYFIIFLRLGFFFFI